MKAGALYRVVCSYFGDDVQCSEADAAWRACECLATTLLPQAVVHAHM